MIEVTVTGTQPAFAFGVQLERAYAHALLAAPEEPIEAIITAIGTEDHPGRQVVMEDGRPAHVGVLRRDPQLVRPLTIADNLMLAYSARGLEEAQATASTQELLQALGIEGQADAYPDDLPLGVQRLIGAERDLDPEADLVVVDDLLTGLTDQEQGAVIAWISRLPERIGGVLLIHSAQPVWAMGMADRVMVVHEGKVAAHDTLQGVVRKPVNTWAANKLPNGYRGDLNGGVITLADGRKVHTHVQDERGPVLATVHPRSVLLHREKPEGSALNVWHGRVAGLEPAGDRVRVHILGLTPIVAEVTVASCRRLDLPVGGPIWASFKASAVNTFVSI